MSIPTPPSNPTSNPNRLLLIGALGGAVAVLILVVAVLIGYWLGRTSQPHDNANIRAATPSSTAQNSTTASMATPSLLAPVITAPLDGTDSVTPDTGVSGSTSIPTDPALAAEEIDRHSDQQQQLTAQKQTLSQQVSDSNQLIELKAEQIRLLEAELAKQP